MRDRTTVIGRVALAGEAVQIPDVLADPDYSYGAQTTVGYRALLGVPIVLDDELIGAIAVGHNVPGPFADEQVELVKTFADQAAIAIANARLIDAVDRQRTELSRFVLPQVATLISSKQGSSCSPGVLSRLHRRDLEEESMSVPREGGCACGAVRYRLTTDPLFTHCCHCLNCQRQTGSAFVINALIEADRVELLAGVPQPVDVPRDDGSNQRIFRCPNCQVAVFSEYGRPEVRFVRGGTLDQPSGVTPDVHIFTRSKLPWITLPDSAPVFDVYYDRRTLWPAASLERLEAILTPADSNA